MAEYITRMKFYDFADEVSAQEQVRARYLAESRSPKGATFLSHSSKDTRLLAGVMRVLEGHGANVYIDRKDPTLPPYTNEETAATLKNRIDQTNKFVLLATENSKESKWVPWELGIADSKKGLDRIALLPAVEKRDDTSWTSWEYMGLYSRIVWGKLQGHDKEVWMVLDEQKNEGIELSKWLKSP